MVAGIRARLGIDAHPGKTSLVAVTSARPERTKASSAKTNSRYEKKLHARSLHNPAFLFNASNPALRPRPARPACWMHEAVPEIGIGPLPQRPDTFLSGVTR